MMGSPVAAHAQLTPLASFLHENFKVIFKIDKRQSGTNLNGCLQIP